MINAWVIALIALAYVGFLFAVAYYGDKLAKRRKASRERPTIYALSLAVYCTSWTFFGSVGLATTTGLDFLAVYLGPIAVFAFGRPLIERIIKLSKSQNITSIADFLAARYGKNPMVAAIVTIIAVAGVLPYIALQLKAVSLSVTTLAQPLGWAPLEGYPGPLTDITFLVAVTMAIFAILFGTRHIEATEHQEGLMLAIATESVVKVAAFLIVGTFITYSMFGGIEPLIEKATHHPEIIGLFARGFHGGTWLTVTFLSSVCILLLTRQFHVTIVENNSPREVGRATWLFPVYLIAINLFVVPIAIAGLLTFPAGTVDKDMFLLALPLSQNAQFFTILAFLGGLSAATAMVIVESVALSIMVCNDLVMPIILHRRPVTDQQDMGAVVLIIRRTAIFAILLLAYIFYRLVGGSYGLASIGLLSFAAMAQFAPAFFGGLVWRGATARGAIAGILAGFTVWAFTLLLPYFVKAGLISPDIMDEGLFGWGLLRPEMLFYMSFDKLTHGVVWSLFFNMLAYVTVSLLRAPEPIERLQANVFIENNFPGAVAPALRPWRTSVTVEDLIRTVSRYLGEERTQRSFADYATNNNLELIPKAEADIHLMRFTENLLASAIGTASSRLVMSLTIRRRNVGMKSAMKLLDDASEAIQYNRDLLQSALDQVGQGIAVFDRDLRLICWNREFREILSLPPSLRQVGVPLDQLVRHMAGNGRTRGSLAENVISDRLRKYVVTMETFQERLDGGERVVEIRTNPMPQGGIVVTYTNITDRVAAAEALARANETLERRVRERTTELVQANKALGEAKAKADEANLDKTRFLAAASHDILQPLNAARLYVSSLVERKPPGEMHQLSRNIDASLEAVEEILNALLDISRLDTGALKPQIDTVAIGELLQQLRVEFEPQAVEKGLSLRFMPCSLYVRSDRRLLRRVLQNLISNAIKYTDEGSVLLGCRRKNGAVVVEVHDTGSGIPLSKHGVIFKEFERLNTGAKTVAGIGLGLSIVERIGRMLDHPIKLSSRPGHGSVFGVRLPIGDAGGVERPLVPIVSAAYYRQFTGCVVMCVDNEPAILDGMQSLLGNWQCTVLTARDADEAVLVIEERGVAPDIILADYHLERGTGLECIATIRAKAGFEVPAILITADRSPDVEQDARAMELQVLRKPLKPAALRALMARLYSRRTAAE